MNELESAIRGVASTYRQKKKHDQDTIYWIVEYASDLYEDSAEFSMASLFYGIEEWLSNESKTEYHLTFNQMWNSYTERWKRVGNQDSQGGASEWTHQGGKHMMGEYRSISSHLNCTREINIGEFDLMIEAQEICDIRNIDIPRPGGNPLYPVSVLREAVQKILLKREKTMTTPLNMKFGFVEGTLGDIIDDKATKNLFIHLIKEAFYLGKFTGSGLDYSDRVMAERNRKRLVPINEPVAQEDEEAASFHLDQIITLFGIIAEHSKSLRNDGDFFRHLGEFNEIAEIEAILLKMAKGLR